MISLITMFLACGDKEEDTSVEVEESVCECQDETAAEEVVEETPQDTSTPQ